MRVELNISTLLLHSRLGGAFLLVPLFARAIRPRDHAPLSLVHRDPDWKAITRRTIRMMLKRGQYFEKLPSRRASSVVPRILPGVQSLFDRLTQTLASSTNRELLTEPFHRIISSTIMRWLQTLQSRRSTPRTHHTLNTSRIHVFPPPDQRALLTAQL